jgi:hypothetical protein
MSASLTQDTGARTPGQIVAAEPVDGMVTLRVSGGKPLHVRADLLAEGTSWTAGAPAWHEVALYERPSGDRVVSLRVCRRPGGNSDLFYARIFPTLDEALSWLLEFDPTADLGADIDASDRRISTTEIALRAAALRQRADRVDLQYRALIGELLYRLDVGE